MRDGASWLGFYFDNFYSAFSAAEQDELLTPEAKQMAGDAYAGSMNYWNRSSSDLLHRLLYSDIKTYLVELLMKQNQWAWPLPLKAACPFSTIAWSSSPQAYLRDTRPREWPASSF
jgi:hypothetical protein